MPFHRNNNSLSAKYSLTCCVSGNVIPMDAVEDNIFSTKILGDGYAVVPSDKKIYPPDNAVVTDVSPDSLAISLKLDNGVKLLINVGIDLVKVNPEAVRLLVKVGDKVCKDDPIAEFTLDDVETLGSKGTICVLFTDSDQLKELTVSEGKKTNLDIALEYKI